MKQLHLDELRDYAIRCLSDVRPGMKVISVHCADIDVVNNTCGVNKPFAKEEVVTSVRKMTFADLHPSVRDTVDTDAKNVILFKNDNKSNSYKYASDAGVEPYDTGFVNDANFLLDVESLKALGIEPILSGSESYMEVIESSKCGGCYYCL